MKKILRSIVVIAIAAILFFVGHNQFSSVKLAMKADDLSIEPGKTKLQDLIDAGFTYEWPNYFKPMTTVDGKKFITTSLIIKKNNEDYASVGLINKSRTNEKIENCVIGDTVVYTTNESKHKFNEVSINNDNLLGLKLDDLKAKFKDGKVSEGKDNITFIYDKYEYTFGYDDEKNIKSIECDIDEYKLK